MIKRILVALSGTPFTPTAVQYAIEIAQTHGAEVTGVTVVDVGRLEDVGPVPIGGAAAAHELAEHRVHVTEERVEEQIERFESACRERGLVSRVVRESGNALEQLTAYWRYHDLTVVGLRGLFDYGVFDDPHEQVTALLAKGVRPILAVAKEHRPIRGALLAYSGSPASAMTVKRFIQLLLWPGIEVGIVCFVGDIKKTDERLADAAAYCRSHGVTAETMAVEGHAKDGLLAHAASWNADILVMGMSTRSKLLKLIMGDTVHRAILEAEIPLFLSQ